jgi:hypothetical protein
LAAITGARSGGRHPTTPEEIPAGLALQSRWRLLQDQVEQDLCDLMGIDILALVRRWPDSQLLPRHVLPHSLESNEGYSWL